MSNQTDMHAVVAALGANDRFVVTSHEAPDGDALGSLLGMGLALRELGKDVVMFLGGPAPLPGEYRFLDVEKRGLSWWWSMLTVNRAASTTPGSAPTRLALAQSTATSTRSPRSAGRSR